MTTSSSVIPASSSSSRVAACLVLHLATLIAFPRSYLAPRSFVETSVLGTQNVLETVRAAGYRVINTSTSEFYGTPDEVPLRETHALEGQSPYSASKNGADKLCEAPAHVVRHRGGHPPTVQARRPGGDRDYPLRPRRVRHHGLEPVEEGAN